MTDIASDLADKIMALINSKPRSPTKDELVAVLAPVIAPPPAYMVTCELAAQLPKLDCEPGSWVAVSSEMMHRDLLPIPIYGKPFTADLAASIAECEARILDGLDALVTGEIARPNEWYLTKLEDDGTISRTKVDPYEVEAPVAKREHTEGYGKNLAAPGRWGAWLSNRKSAKPDGSKP